LREAVENLVKALVDNPDAVTVNERQDRSATVFAVSVAETDMGKVIGREGRTAKALRSLMHAASLKYGRRYSLDIVE
jgi:uncharacterized protein